MIPPECPAPPRDYKERFRRESAAFDRIQAAIDRANAPAVQEFTLDQINILDKIRQAINAGDPFKGNPDEATRDQTESDNESSNDDFADSD
jgi:hypothetical protein